MARNTAAFACLALAIALIACSGESLADENGKIEVGRLKHAYTDGSYIAYGSYISDSGFAPALQIYVSGGVINKASFDYFSIDGQRLSASTEFTSSEKLAQLNSDRQKLANELIQNQDPDSVDIAAPETEYARDFRALAKALALKLVAYDKPVAVNFKYEYKALYQDNATGQVFTLNVVCLGGEIQSISFRHFLPPGREARLDENYISGFFAQYGIPYAEEVGKLEKTEGSIESFAKDLPPANGPAFLYEAFNAMASEISVIAKPVPASLFLEPY
ncbi:MAG: hypothetical protein LBC69_04575 [Eubacteriaceae bacterium]|nr:hypothetical protein [Eubacteriaceae bacterium]